MTTMPAWLSALTSPSSIALVGASDDPSRVSGRAMSYLRRYGYAGGVYPVNNRATTVQGLPAYRTLDDVPVVPDLAVVALGASQACDALQACADKGVKTAVVYASGFAEQDQDGARLQQEMAAIVAGTDMRVLGPNCLGAVHLATATTATFASALDEGELESGPVALLTQSGAFASFVYGAGRSAGIRFGFLATTGNEMDLTISDLFAGAVEMPSVGTVLLHMEGLRDRDKFVAAATRARELGKPVAVIKVGSSLIGARAARAHTGAEVGQDLEYEDMFDDLGVSRVQSMEALVDAGQALQHPHKIGGRRVSIVSISGGTGVLMADVAVQEHLEVPELPAAVRARLSAVLPAFASTVNPVDVTGGVFDDLPSFESVLIECASDDSTDVLLVAVGNSVSAEDALTTAILRAAATGSKPVFVAWVGGSGEPRRRLMEAGIPTFGDPNRAVSAAALAVRHSLR